MADPRIILVTGGAGYVGSVAVPKLLEAGHRVKVLDLYLYGDNVLPDDPDLTQIKGDIRDCVAVDEAMEGCDTVIHLACISNDPSFELDPELGKSINLDAFPPLVESAKAHGVNRFVYASSSSVYGVKDDPDVTEDLPLEPLTDYSRFKADCEEILADAREPGFTAVTLRPATVCGYGPRLRLDLTVNILTNHAYHRGKITVFGGDQLRPNIHIDDVSRLYVEAMEWPDELIDGEVFNAGYENYSVMQIAEMVRNVVGEHVEIERTSTDDNRSYRISSAKVDRILGFRPERTIEDAVRDLVAAFEAGKVFSSFDDPRWFNIKMMQTNPLIVAEAIPAHPRDAHG
ncbi:MAG: NAD-dependent epimerase/dehydratase family protein [Solirubrobacteraceae bacterium]